MMRAMRRGTRAWGTPQQVPGAAPTHGFTLAELLVVIVVIGILAAIAIPVFLSQADKASDTALKSDLANAAKLLQVAEANGETLPSEFTAGEVVDLGTAGTFTSSETLTVTGSGETLCVEGVSGSGNVFSADVAAGLRDYTCSGTQSGSMVTDGLLLHFDAGDAASYPGSGSDVFDLSGNGNDGMLGSAASHSGSEGGAFVFSGGGGTDTVSTGVPMTDLPALESWSMSAWFKPTVIPPDDHNGVLWGAAFYSGAAIYWMTNNGEMTVEGLIRSPDSGGTWRDTGEYTVEADTIYHMTFVNDRSDGRIKLYVNGVLHASDNGTTEEYKPENIVKAGNIGISKRQVMGGGSETYTAFNGEMYDTKLYDKALSPAEVRANFEANRDRFGL